MDKNTLHSAPVSLLSQSVWLSLDAQVRVKLVRLFSIEKTGNVEVESLPEGGVIKSDGYTAGDLMKISTKSLQHLLASDSTDFYKLFYECVDNIDALLEAQGEEGNPEEKSPAQEENEDSKPRRALKKDKHGAR